MNARVCFIACCLLFVAALARYWVSDKTELVPHDPESFRLARSIAEKGEFANPFVPLDTGPSAVLAPAFPAFLALLIRAFGDGTAGMYAIKVAAAITLAGCLALFPVASKALGMGYLNGIIAASIWIAARIGTAGGHGHQEVAMFGWEAFYGAILVMITVICFRRYLEAKEPSQSRRLAWCLGCVLGVLTLTAFTAAVIAVGFMGLLLLREKLAMFKKPGLLLIVLVPIVIVAPWTIRNALVFKRFIPVRSLAGLELSISNNDCASPTVNQNFDCFASEHPNANIDQARKVLILGEPAYSDFKLREALDWIKGHPARFLELCALRFAAFWIPPANEGPYSLLGVGHRTERMVIWCMTLLSLGGLVILYRRDRASASVCLVCLALYPAIYYIVQYEYRYRYPILWITFLLGSLPITVFAQWMYASLKRVRSRLAFEWHGAVKGARWH